MVDLLDDIVEFRSCPPVRRSCGGCHGLCVTLFQDYVVSKFDATKNYRSRLYYCRVCRSLRTFIFGKETVVAGRKNPPKPAFSW